MGNRTCKFCEKSIRGRRDKIFCSATCKYDYHHRLKQVTNMATASIDKILHRNRSTLLEIMGENTDQKTISREVLDQKNFKFDYMTGYYENALGKRYHVVYDYAWMAFKDGRIVIVRRS